MSSTTPVTPPASPPASLKRKSSSDESTSAAAPATSNKSPKSSERCTKSSKSNERRVKKPRLYHTPSEFITLVVGSEEKLVAVHRGVLCAASPFFEAACKPEWMSADNQVIKLPEDGVEAVQRMIYFMYHGKIQISAKAVRLAMEEHSKEATINTETAMKSAWGMFVQLYVLGEKFLMPTLQSHAIDAILTLRAEALINLGIVPFAYENTPEDSKLRKLIVSSAKIDMTSADFRLFKNVLCAEFCYDLAASAMEEIDGVDGILPYSIEWKWSEAPTHCEELHQHKRAPGKPCKVVHKFVEIDEKDLED